ncbi:hypothetical protein SLE2022_014840 [Rubroshorea leprosula]
MGYSVLLWILFSSVISVLLPLSAEAAVFTRPTSNASPPKSHQPRRGFILDSTMRVGRSPNQVNAVGLCLADLKQGACVSCPNNTIFQLQENCNNNTEAVGWSNLCTAHYSSRDIFGAEEALPDYFIPSYQFVSNNVNQLNVTLNSLREDLTNRAASGGRYAATDPTDLINIDASVQCSLDLSQQECRNCLETARGKIQQYCYVRIGCRILQPSCILKYEAEDDLSRPSRLPSSPPRPTQGRVYTRYSNFI